MASKPRDLIYGLEDRPPFTSLLILGCQHIFLMSSTLVLPVVLVTEIGGTFDEVRSVVALTMIACGLGTIVQSLRCRFIGSGFVCPNLCGPNFFTASMEAAWLGGLPLLRGMTIVAGVAEAIFARFARRLAFLFPPEITGLVVLMVAQGLITLGVSKFLGITFEGEPIQTESVLIASICLAVMIGLNIWGRGNLRLYSVFLGFFCGYLLSVALGVLPLSQLSEVLSAPWVGLPFLENSFELAFDWSLVPVFVIVSITGALKSFGNLIMCEKINDEAWRAPDMRRISAGLMADSAAVAASGLLGGMASDTSASNVALTKASGATSRGIAYVAGGLFILLAFFPKISGLLSAMPSPVMGAVLVYVSSFMIVSGMQIILGSGMDTRKTFVIGIPLIFGLSLDLAPSLFADVPQVLRPLFESPLTLSTVLAVLLHQLLRIGGSHRAEL
ncbi:MAG: solute carrier family 23 protein [Chromatiaceae bacterium]